jgi:hypothetical protein
VLAPAASVAVAVPNQASEPEACVAGLTQRKLSELRFVLLGQACKLMGVALFAGMDVGLAVSPPLHCGPAAAPVTVNDPPENVPLTPESVTVVVHVKAVPDALIVQVAGTDPLDCACEAGEKKLMPKTIISVAK